MIVALECIDDDGLIGCIKVGFAGEVSSQSADSILDAAFLPWSANVAEEGLNIDLGCEFVMQGKFRAVAHWEAAY